MIVEKSINLLGCRAKDLISGGNGIVTSICFDLYGCIQVIITPGKVGKDGKEVPSIGWIDINRARITNNKKIMKLPDFEIKYNSFESVHGPANKP